MTSSKRHLKTRQPKWDRSIQRYKSYDDIFCEKGLFSILFLACGRPEVTRRSLFSTLDAVANYQDEVEWVFIENGGCDENFNLFNSIPLERKVIIKQENFGINEAINQLLSISRGEFCVVLENDWENRCPHLDFLSIAKDILNEKQDVGIVQLRAIFDPCENFGFNKEMYNVWSCKSLSKAKVFNECTQRGHRYLVGTGFYGFNNNPSVMRKSLYRSLGPYPEPEVGCDPAHGETLYQEKVLESECAIAHIGSELYFHIGQQKTVLEE